MTPSHYTFADKEVIDMMASIWGNEAARMFLTLSAFKYQMRAGRKTDDPTSDLEKARHCLELATKYDEIGPESTDNNFDFDEGWNNLKEFPKPDKFVFVRYISKNGFPCVQIGRYDPDLDVFMDLDGYRINNPIKWKLINFANNAPSNSCVNPKQQDADKEDEWIDWRGFGDDPKPEPYLVVDLKITKCSDEITKCPDEDVRYGFGYWNPEINDWNTLLEFDKSEHSIQWRKIKY